MSKFYSIVLTIVITARLVTPLFIFVTPAGTLIANIILDSVDGQLCYMIGWRWRRYNLMDKLLDWWWYINILRFFFHTALFPIAFVLLAYRMIGMIAVFMTANESLYIYFPNLLEWIFVLTILFPAIPMDMRFAMSLLWAFVIEWSHHKTHIHLISKYLFRNEILWEKNEPRISRK